ncbi:uncharacterized protein LOC129588905 [Paramacrobiotus metropolitanus]|uniref:uncharacterized protein LOC129588905 n=1 Tax=Paramacrobiotus metropolitanus TaxID=2943436 RepID=UPI002445814A|nr:uncharacterized protein LOC129588905 [Paramacrobiotus metropolitanus]
MDQLRKLDKSKHVAEMEKLRKEFAKSLKEKRHEDAKAPAKQVKTTEKFGYFKMERRDAVGRKSPFEKPRETREVLYTRDQVDQTVENAQYTAYEQGYQEAVEQMQEENFRLNATIRDLTNRSLQARSTAPPPPPRRPPPVNTAPVTVPLPPGTMPVKDVTELIKAARAPIPITKYNGNREEFDSFIIKFRRAVVQNAWDEATAVTQLGAALTGEAQQWYNLTIRSQPHLDNIEAWLTLLTERFTDKNRATTALNELTTRVWQAGKEDIDTYYQKMVSLRDMAGMIGSDKQLCTFLTKGIRDYPQLHGLEN